jgi:hypothetical protein
MNKKSGGGFYSVMIRSHDGARSFPYVVFATNEWQAARLVCEETGYAARQNEVEGPYHRP